MLLVTNGDSAAGCIEGAGLAGEVLPWRDVLHEGPVPAGLSDAELGEIRARFLADRGWASVRETSEGFAERDAALEGFGGHEEIVLVFEHDLYDQLQLVQGLDRLLRWDLGDTRLSPTPHRDTPQDRAKDMQGPGRRSAVIAEDEVS